MLCEKPYRPNGSDTGYRCGQCDPCRWYRRRVWTHRLCLESFFHNASSFVTLTYDEGAIPAGGSLRKKDLQDFMKRLRFEIQPAKVRYYAVGEYGSQTLRPHYHLALFGLGVEHSEIVEKCWSKGHVLVLELLPESCAYVAGYVQKKIGKYDKRISHLEKEFSLMSLKPGLGAPSVQNLVDFMTKDIGAMELIRTGDVPSFLKHGKFKMPLGRYLQEKLRLHYGFEKKTVPEETIKNKKKEVSELRRLSAIAEGIEEFEVVRKEKEKDKQKVLNLKSRMKIREKGTL